MMFMFIILHIFMRSLLVGELACQRIVPVRVKITWFSIAVVDRCAACQSHDVCRERQ